MVSESPLHQLPGMAGFRARVEDTLLGVVAAEDELMAQMGGHLITAGGKRARPLFTVASAAALAGDATAVDAAVTDEVILGGVSVELVQVGSLCHDDVIDEAETRRSVESVNMRWGNLKAILAGDFLLAKASEIAAGLGTEVAGLLAATIGRLCEGEVNELRHAYDPARTIDSYLTAIDGKTAALFATACRVGGIVGDLPRGHIDQLTDFGRHYGMAFQIVDDVLDVIATDEQLGKPAGHDIAEGIYNLPVLHALEELGGDLGVLLGGPIDGADLDTARRLVRTSSGVDRSVDLAREYVERAVTSLDPLGGTPSSVALAGAAEHLLVDVEACSRPSLSEVDADSSSGDAPGADASSEISSIFADLSDVWAAQAQRWYDRARSPDSEFVPEDAVSDTIDLVEHLAPIVERSVALTIDLLRPWAVALQERQTDG